MRPAHGLLLLVCVIALPLSSACADDRVGAVYDPEADAARVIDSALAEAGSRSVPALIVFGANWCHDSRGLADRIATDGALAPFMAEHYAAVFVDIGLRDRNLDQLARFGVEAVYGTPTLVVAAPDGRILNADTVHDWRAVYDAGAADLAAYFARYAEAAPAVTPEGAVDIAAAASAWPPYLDAMAAIDAVPEEERAHAEAYYRGLARALTRNVMGRVGSEQELGLAARADLEALGLQSEPDLTGDVIARMATRRADLEARRRSELAETAEANEET